jgi:hypothetical protein
MVTACSVGTLVVTLTAMSCCGFVRVATLIAARASLMRESDLAIVRLADDLRTQETPVIQRGDDDGIAVGPHVYVVRDGRLCFYESEALLNAGTGGEVVAWNVGQITVSDTATTSGQVIRLHMVCPDVTEIWKRSGPDRPVAERSPLSRDVYLVVLP